MAYNGIRRQYDGAERTLNVELEGPVIDLALLFVCDFGYID